MDWIRFLNSVTYIESYVFEDCTSLRYNEYDNAYYLGNESNPYLLLVKAKDTSITSCTINENTKLINNYAFKNCTSLTNIVIPNKVTTIGSFAFEGCSSLKSIVIPNSVTCIEMCAFENCKSLERIYIPASVITIGWGAFLSCPSLFLYCEAPYMPSEWEISNELIFWRHTHYYKNGNCNCGMSE